MDEEPCEGKLSRTVLKTSRKGDFTAEFNPAQQIQRIARPDEIGARPKEKLHLFNSKYAIP